MFVIYGGTFDMPHCGHVQTLRWLLEQGHHVAVVPATGHEFKPWTISTYIFRKVMCRLAFEGYVEPFEEEVMTMRPTPIMSIDTLKCARAAVRARRFFVNPSSEIGLAIGPDVDVSRWTGIEEIQREGFTFVRCPEAPNPRSSQIREMITMGKPWETYVPRNVAAFIKLHKLYGWKDRS